MPGKFYTTPIQFNTLVKGEEAPKVELKTSIAKMIHLVVTTNLGESRYNPEFGCEIWEFDFENISNMNAWKEKVTKAITKCIVENEKRLKGIKVKIEIMAEEFSDKKVSEASSIRKRLDINVDAFLLITNETYYFNAPIYISPLSIT